VVVLAVISILLFALSFRMFTGFVPATYQLCCSKRDASVHQPARTRDELDVLQLGDKSSSFPKPIAHQCTPALGPGNDDGLVVSGHRYHTLQRLPDRLAEQIDVIESSRDLCALARRLQAMLKELDDLPQSSPASKADEIAERRRQRGAQRG
jgi:hypothetical protein